VTIRPYRNVSEAMVAAMTAKVPMPAGRAGSTKSGKNAM
jgi:hypothetical protein